MIEILVFFLGVALYFYILLGGADFGAGIVELLTGKKGVRVISKAIAPIWEANHIWIILVVVILFNGFPKVYTSLSTYLHIPLLLALIGIIIRGTSFTFRYYDIPDKKLHDYYTRFFRISSIITPFFFGVILGAIILGRIPSNASGSFYDTYMASWINLFSLATGLFVTVLFGWLASVFLTGETSEEDYSRTAFRFFILLIISGVLVFTIAEIYKVHLVKQFLRSHISIGSLLIATILVPPMWYSIKKHYKTRARILAGVLTLCILSGWFGIQLPVLVFISDGNHLTIWNSVAPTTTIKYLVYALIIGVLIIFPALVYLYKVFKFNKI